MSEGLSRTALDADENTFAMVFMFEIVILICLSSLLAKT